MQNFFQNLKRGVDDARAAVLQLTDETGDSPFRKSANVQMKKYAQKVRAIQTAALKKILKTKNFKEKCKKISF